ncbi:hypothetical protein [Janthinobacterium sp. LB2P10]|uniref:hypothetical protein n=1 Tax=Janthinobacterium sp. LB2P10 TaxID=3424194 RepID=UPI003F1E9D05|nr:hypothetical protein [Janthinobacterium lividum]
MTKTVPVQKTDSAPVSMFPTSASINAAAAKAAPAAKPAAKPLAKPVAKAAAKPVVAKPAAAKPAVAKASVVKPVAKAVVAKPVAKPVAKAAAKPATKPATKAAAKPVTKAVAKPVVQAAVKPAAAKKAPLAKVVAVKEKARKPKLVRDSFTMPEAEYEVLGQVKKVCLKAGFEIKKSELLRIGVALISQIDLATLQSVLASLPQLKTGRPKKD